MYAYVQIASTWFEKAKLLYIVVDVECQGNSRFSCQRFYLAGSVVVDGAGNNGSNQFTGSNSVNSNTLYPGPRQFGGSKELRFCSCHEIMNLLATAPCTVLPTTMCYDRSDVWGEIVSYQVLFLINNTVSLIPERFGRWTRMLCIVKHFITVLYINCLFYMN